MEREFLGGILFHREIHCEMSGSYCGGVMQSYEYKLAVFEGPLDLLLHLIEKHKIDIYDIPIVAITSQYMEQLRRWEKFDIRYSSEFLVMAATLLQIKSRMLLPKAAPMSEEDGGDPRDELVSRLIEYKQIKQLMDRITTRSEANAGCYGRPESCSEWGCERVYRFELQALYNVFQNGLRREKDSEKEDPTVTVEKEEFALADKIAEMEEAAATGERLSFADLLAQGRNRSEKVTIFLAVLEVLKRQLFDLTVADTGEDVYLIGIMKE